MACVCAYAAEPISVAAVGDIMMGTTFPKDLLPPDDGTGIFDHVKHEFIGHDIVFGNLEGPLIDEGEPRKCKNGGMNCYEFRTPTRYASHLRDAGFSVMNIANNHASDFGIEGIESTVSALRSAGIHPLGGKLAATLNVRGKTIALVGFSTSTSTPYSYSVLDIAGAQRIVSELKDGNDLVIVSFHGGAEGKAAQHVSDQDELYAGEKRGNVIRFSKAVIDAGADMVIGHGPHVLRAMELYKGKLILYSLGNFLGYERFNISGPSGESVILKAKIDSETGDFLEAEVVPVRLVNNGIPEKDPDKKGIGILKTLSGEDIQNPGLEISDDGMVSLLGGKSE
ncbi:MAG: CapA family protein [bacterium]